MKDLIHADKPLVYVRWCDSVAHSEWTGVDSIEDVHWIHSAGFLIAETPTSVTLAAAYSDGEANAFIAIPRVCISDYYILIGASETPAYRQDK